MTISHQTFTNSGDRPRDLDTKAVQLRWWELEGDDAAKAVSSDLDALQQAQLMRQTQLLAFARMYGGLPSGLDATLLARLEAANDGLRDRVTYNAVQLATDTTVAKVRKNRPRPYFLTSGGDWKLQRKAKNLNKFVEGVFYGGKVHELAPEAFRDGMVFGTGVIHVFARDRKVCFERVLPDELWVDELEAMDRRPRTMHRVKRVDRRVLAAMFDGEDKASKALRERILAAAQVTFDVATQSLSDLVTVRESWHLPSGPGAKDGRHVISIDGVILTPEDEQGWEHPWFPFAFFHWSPRLRGFWGQGFVEQQFQNQLDLNKTRWVINRWQHIAGGFKVWMPNDSTIPVAHITNGIGGVIKGGSAPPVYLVPPAPPADLFNREERLKRDIFDGAGMNDMAVRAQKPSGLSSGKAIREYKDETNERLATPGENYENFHLDLARLAIETVKQIAGRGSYEVTAPGGRFLSTVDWREVRLDEEQYTLRCFPVSSLPTDPAGRLQTIQEYMQAGIFNPRVGQRLLNFPDLEAVENLQTAMEDWITSILDAIVDELDDEAAESAVGASADPHIDLVLAAEIARTYYAYGQAQGLEEERLELLRRFMQQVQAMQAKAMQAKAMPPPAPPAPPAPMPSAPPTAGDPLAAPTAPPVSDLLPNAA